MLRSCTRKLWGARCARRMLGPSRVMWCCWLRPAPASISLRVMSTGGGSSRRLCAGWLRQVRNPTDSAKFFILYAHGRRRIVLGGRPPWCARCSQGESNENSECVCPHSLYAGWFEHQKKSMCEDSSACFRRGTADCVRKPLCGAGANHRKDHLHL